MIKEVISVEDVLAVLNEAVRLDKEGMKRLLETRVECNESLSKHESIQVLGYPGGPYRVGLLGMLNGLFGTSETGFGIISATYDLVCVNGHKGKELEGKNINDKCDICDGEIKLGDLVSFDRMPDEYLCKQETE
jgi:hypothetical protein